MKIGMVGEGVTDLTLVHQLLKKGHKVVVYERNQTGATGCTIRLTILTNRTTCMTNSGTPPLNWRQSWHTGWTRSGKPR